MFAVAGVPNDKIRSISSAVDKLDKSPRAKVKKEMVEKGLQPEVADEIGEYVKHNGDVSSILNFLRSDARISANEDVKKELDDMELLLRYMEAFSCGRQSFLRPLPRSQPRYTGLIFEVVTKIPSHTSGNGLNDSQVGSITAGGHYGLLLERMTKLASFGTQALIPNSRQKLSRSYRNNSRPRSLAVYHLR